MLRGDVAVTTVPGAAAAIQSSGSNVTISGATLPLFDDFSNLLTTVQTLINDVESLRLTVNTLIIRMRA